MNDYYAIGILLLLAAYLVYMLFNTRKITVVGKVGNPWIVLLIFTILGAAAIWQDHSTMGILLGAMIIIMGALYSMMKSGITDKGIIVMGIQYQWKNMDHITLERKGEALKLTFKVKNSDHFLLFDLVRYDGIKQYKQYFASFPKDLM